MPRRYIEYQTQNVFSLMDMKNTVECSVGLGATFTCRTWIVTSILRSLNATAAQKESWRRHKASSPKFLVYDLLDFITVDILGPHSKAQQKRQ